MKNLKIMPVLVFLFFLYALSRLFDLGFISLLTDKIANFMLPSEPSERIKQAALQRLRLKFTNEQSELLASFMVAQSKYETYNPTTKKPYDSNVFKKNLNAFGYKYYKGSLYQDHGTGTMSPEGNYYGSYHGTGYVGSAREVADWIGRRKSDFINVNNYEQYAEKMKKNDYFGQTAYEYAQGLKQFLT